MNAFEEYLQRLVAPITLNQQEEKDVLEDFKLIRAYMLDILNKCPIFQHILLPSIVAESNSYSKNSFDVYFIVDLTKQARIWTIFDPKRPGFIKVNAREKYGRNTNRSLSLQLPLVDCEGFVHRKKVTNLMQNSLEHGLIVYGCYIRGHKGDIYELELNKTMENNKLLTIMASSEKWKLSIDFKILVKLSSNAPTTNVVPFPPNSFKSCWYACADCVPAGPLTAWRDRVFAIITPKCENGIAEKCPLALVYRLLKHLLPNLKEFILKSAIFEELLYQKHSQSKMLLGEVLITVLHRMERNFYKHNYPFYWNTKVNLLQNISTFYADFVCDELKALLKQLTSMKTDVNIGYEAVEQLFGVQVNADIIQIDSFGAFKSF